MLCYCPRSGTNYRTDNFRGRWKGIIEAPHPIFSAPVDALLQRTGDLIAQRLNGDPGKLSEDQIIAKQRQEARLLFLALLNATKQVTWDCAADPSPKTVMLHSEPLVRFVNWQTTVHAPTLLLPRFVIRWSNRHLEDIGGWLEALYASKEAWEKNKQNHELRDRVARKEAALYKVMNSSIRSERNYALKLWAWAREAAQVPAAIDSLWGEMFLLNGVDLYSDRYTLTDFRNMRQHMEEELNIVASPLYVHAVLHHVRKLEGIRERGLDYWLGISSGSDEDSTFKILDDSADSHNISVAIQNHAPDHEPVRHEYAADLGGKVAFLRARAGWQLHLAKQEALNALLAKKIAEEQEERLDSIYLAEVAAEDDDELNQLRLELDALDKQED